MSGGVLVVDFFSKSRIMDLEKLSQVSRWALTNEWRMVVSGWNRETTCGGFLLSKIIVPQIAIFCKYNSGGEPSFSTPKSADNWPHCTMKGV